MKVYSDVLTYPDLIRALPGSVVMWSCKAIPNTRVRARGWEVSLSGTSPYRSQWHGENHQAATWDEHGEWMAELFKRDPFARISWYDGAAEFVLETTRVPRGQQAPWLADRRLLDIASLKGRLDAAWTSLEQNGGSGVLVDELADELRALVLRYELVA